MPVLQDATRFDTDIEQEWPRLLRLCARVSGDADAAEDLVQETFIEAWRSQQRLRDPDAQAAWLSGIARNVCLRWLRRQGRDQRHRVPNVQGTPDFAAELIADDIDLEIELERDELAILLDRAMSLLPPQTRLALVQRYVEDSPQARVAKQLGLSEGAVAMRLRRGKLALRRILANELRDDAIAFGLVPEAGNGWQHTMVWCPMCGAARLIGKFDPLVGFLVLRCVACFPAFGLYEVRCEQQADVFRGVSGFKAAYRRVLAASGDYYRQALAENVARCPRCEGEAEVIRRLPSSELPRARESRGMHVLCRSCGSTYHVSLGGLIQSLPEVRQFRQVHSRITMSPEYEVEMHGSIALVTRIRSVTTGDAITIITDETTLEVLQVFSDTQPLQIR